MEKLIDNKLRGNKLRGNKLLLHSCCAPCSSYVLEFLLGKYDITVFFYNPNITELKEYELRRDEQKRLLVSVPGHYSFIEAEYDSTQFYEIAKGLEANPEGGGRCYRCIELRLRETAHEAKEGGFDWFATTLTVSPMKDAGMINEIGERISREIGVKYLVSDFKKNGGAQRSIELSKEYGLYRQKYCGCEYSRK